jgi:chaperonin GroEL
VPETTNDAKTIIDELEHENELVQEVVKDIKDALDAVHNESGDGRKTTAIILGSLYKTLLEKTKSKSAFDVNKVNVMELRRQVLKEAEQAISLLKKKTKKSTKKDILSVAISASESEEIGKGIAEMFETLGKHAIISVQDGGYDTTFESIKGLDLKCGITSPFLVNTGKNEYINKIPYILVTEQQINSTSQIAPIVHKIIEEKQGRPLVIIADNFSKEILDAFVIDKDTISIIALKVPVFGDTQVFIDYATMTNARFISKYDKLEEIKLEDLGECDVIQSNKDRTILLGCKGSVDERVKLLKETETETQYEKEKLDKRISTLMGGVGVIKVGAKTEGERRYLTKKVKDAINSTRSAIQEGVVVGGGKTIKEIGEEMKDSIIGEALKKPYEQIIENAGEEGDIVYDPAKVERIAIQTACNKAATLITIDSISAHIKKDDKKDTD